MKIIGQWKLKIVHSNESNGNFHKISEAGVFILTLFRYVHIGIVFAQNYDIAGKVFSL